MFAVCVNAKYGYWKFWKQYKNIHLTNVCDENYGGKENIVTRDIQCFVTILTGTVTVSSAVFVPIVIETA